MPSLFWWELSLSSFLSKDLKVVRPDSVRVLSFIITLAQLSPPLRSVLGYICLEWIQPWGAFTGPQRLKKKKDLPFALGPAWAAQVLSQGISLH